MSKTVVIYQSKYGYTEKYSKWIAEALSCELLKRKDVKVQMLTEYDTVIYGGGLYAGGVNGIDLLTKNFDILGEKNLILFTCGLADPNIRENTENIKAGLSKVLTPQMQEKIKLFHLRGGIDYAKLSLMHKSMMAMLYKMTRKKDASSLSDEDKEMLATYGKAVDFTDREMIDPLVSYVRKL